MAGQGRRRPKVRRFTAPRRAEFLEHLRRTGNYGAAAKAIGLDRSSAEQRRKRDAEFAIACVDALAEASRRLAGATNSSDGVADAEFERVRRNRHGRLMIVKTSTGKWCQSKEKMFIDALRQCGNIAASARLVGVSESLIWQRRRQWPGFAATMEEALDEAELALEFRIACQGNNLGMGTLASDCPSEEGLDCRVAYAPRNDGEAAMAVPFDAEFALRFLKWREEKRRGRNPRGGRPEKRVSFDEAIEQLDKKLVAFGRREEARKLAEGWTKDEEGRMIPPGWVRAA